MTEASDIIAVEAIHRLKARYFRYMDTKDWRAWRDQFTDNAALIIDHGVSVGGADARTDPPIIGGDAIVAHVRSIIGTARTVHHGHMPEIDILSSVTARGIWAMEDIVEWPDGRQIRGYGHYHEEYRLVGQCWKIERLHLTRLRIDLSGPWQVDPQRMVSERKQGSDPVSAA